MHDMQLLWPEVKLHLNIGLGHRAKVVIYVTSQTGRLYLDFLKETMSQWLLPQPADVVVLSISADYLLQKDMHTHCFVFKEKKAFYMLHKQPKV